jgi:DNA-binding FrmR family transcriptional regulator
VTLVAIEKQKLLNRVRRLRGQVDAIERAVIADEECGDLMRLIAATRGAINGMMAEVVNGHIRTHMIDPNRTPSQAERDAAIELVDVLRTYIR